MPGRLRRAAWRAEDLAAGRPDEGLPARWERAGAWEGEKGRGRLGCVWVGLGWFDWLVWVGWWCLIGWLCFSFVLFSCLLLSDRYFTQEACGRLVFGVF